MPKSDIQKASPPFCFLTPDGFHAISNGKMVKTEEKPIEKAPLKEPQAFIAHDWCGWNERNGRFTHMPSGKTLLCEDWMGQEAWDKAQLAWFTQLDENLIVHKCPDGPYRETGNTYGSVTDIIKKLKERLPELPHGNETPK